MRVESQQRDGTTEDPITTSAGGFRGISTGGCGCDVGLGEQVCGGGVEVGVSAAPVWQGCWNAAAFEAH